MRLSNIKVCCFNCKHNRVLSTFDTPDIHDSTVLALTNTCEHQPYRDYADMQYGSLYVRCPNYQKADSENMEVSE